MLSRIRNTVRKNAAIRQLIGYHFASSGLFDKYLTNYKLCNSWQSRIADVVACPDNQFIPRVANAGAVSGGKQVMHNGLKIHLGSYYGPEYVQLLKANKGVHEPQEEKVFAEVLNHIPAGATMIEMGAFWSFYSMWFNQRIKNSRNFMIEPDSFNLGHGKRNFGLNKMKGSFTQAFIGAQSSVNSKIPTICIDDFVKQNKIDFIDILHSDIQGYEFEMLKGAERTISDGRISFIFISTHSPEVHDKCKEFLIKKNFKIISEADLNNTYSEDGLIVAVNPSAYSYEKIPVAQKNTK